MAANYHASNPEMAADIRCTATTFIRWLRASETGQAPVIYGLTPLSFFVTGKGGACTEGA
jgi:hypothetical protein